jgi:hypothetical protein
VHWGNYPEVKALRKLSWVREKRDPEKKEIQRRKKFERSNWKRIKPSELRFWDRQRPAGELILVNLPYLNLPDETPALPSQGIPGDLYA